ncbi:glucose-methanol-choline oxidoreductase-like protein [Hypoxylon trugodes]|uniref:glucose-methanol-choline oxidoreductase-like protein n=1 Tax=Hypoxylon trugodes TaxID=326681 RepID=UPI00219A75E2|nr:glucose-methanol-choline oxidoreductase-like protein [Hypoxylon trugodes]KAI1391661.1 glucose-methanol-choline oxidoreductase-like protein [Hypoxylon trugodes]
MTALRKEYDFVIVGGGTAGLVVASRLTEDSSISVLVLEAGENTTQDPRIAVPGMWPAVLGTDLDWDFLTVPQENLNGRQVGHPQGRGLGGSSALNAEVFVPPSAAGFDAWESFGNPRWNWKGLEPYFRKSHTIVKPNEGVVKKLDIAWVDSPENGTNGPIQVSFPRVVDDPLPGAWVETMKGLGYGLTGNPFSGKAMGGWNIPWSIDPESGTRSYAASAYYGPASSRSNLEVLIGATVSRVWLEDSSGGSGITARGVSFKAKDGHEHQVSASREVILAAGVFQSPKILELSGIGDKALLEKHGIKTRINNPNVGENLQDHMLVGVSFEAAEGVMTGDELVRQEPSVIQAVAQMYEEQKTGPLASGSVLSLAYMPIMSQLLENLEPNLQSSLDTAIKRSAELPMSELERQQFDFLKSNLLSSSEHDSSAIMFLLPVQVNMNNGPKQNGMMRDPKPGNFISLGISPLHPFSRGTSHISSSNPLAPPSIDPRYLSHPLDIEVYARHLMGVEIVAKSSPLSNYLKPGSRRAQPGDARVDTLEKAKKYIREGAMTCNHPVGTCAMLPREKGGVVDPRLKVYGVEGLRIVDGSIMPMVPRANTQSSVYAIAEKAVDLIKEDHNLK